MKNYGVRKVNVLNSTGESVQAWELFRRIPVKHGIKKSSFFDVDTFKIIHTYD